MKTYQVEIREILAMTVEVEAENRQQEETMVWKRYKDCEYVLDADHFKGVKFTTRLQNERMKKHSENKEHDR